MPKPGKGGPSRAFRGLSGGGSGVGAGNVDLSYNSNAFDGDLNGVESSKADGGRLSSPGSHSSPWSGT